MKIIQEAYKNDNSISQIALGVDNYIPELFVTIVKGANTDKFVKHMTPHTRGGVFAGDWKNWSKIKLFSKS